MDSLLCDDREGEAPAEPNPTDSWAAQQKLNPPQFPDTFTYFQVYLSALDNQMIRELSRAEYGNMSLLGEEFFRLFG